MKDLRIRYEIEDDLEDAEYDTIMDFTDKVESGEIDSVMLGRKKVVAEFFENPLLHKHFDTVADLYEHCKAILK